MGKYDFSGWATVNDLVCTDGRTIRRDAFKADDGRKVPLVWNHQHESADNVLGHAMLQNRPEGVYAYATFNDTESGKTAKALVLHGDVVGLSICANKLKQTKAGEVLHGCIREISLVLAGANPGAFIDNIMMHSDDTPEEAIIFTGEDIELSHGEDIPEAEEITENAVPETSDTDTVEHADAPLDYKRIFESMNEDQKKLVYIVAGYAGSSTMEHNESDVDYVAFIEHSDNDTKTIKAVFESMNDEQKQFLYAIMGHFSKTDNVEHSDDIFDDVIEHSNIEYEGDNEMKKNAFDRENDVEFEENDTLSHAEQLEIIGDAKRYGSMKESTLQHGITNVEYLFPEAKEVGPAAPRFINKDNKWVAKVMGKVHHTPFSRIKSTFADITADEARAKGYVKGKKKVDEVFSLLKRTTEPQTVYKKQSMDRDDVVDITSFDVIAWLKGEMRMKLDEELARAFLIGDGRTSMHADKIMEDHIRPIWSDDDLYTVHYPVPVTTESTDEEKAKAFIDSVVYAMEQYEGSGDVDLFISKHMLSVCLLLKDSTGHRIYKNKQELATAMLVDDIIPVPQFTGLTRKDEESNTYNLLGIVVDLKDYNVGADKGGAVNMFDDFDIDYNKEKYLIETRCSGALTLPHSAIALEIVTPGA